MYEALEELLELPKYANAPVAVLFHDIDFAVRAFGHPYAAEDEPAAGETLNSSNGANNGNGDDD